MEYLVKINIIKNQDSEYYSNIINLNLNNIMTSNFFILIKNKLISKIDNNNIVDFKLTWNDNINEDLLNMILSSNNNYYPGLKCDNYYTYNPIKFSTSIPFLSAFLNKENIEKIISIEIDVNANRTINRKNRIDTMLFDPENYFFKFTKTF